MPIYLINLISLLKSVRPPEEHIAAEFSNWSEDVDSFSIIPALTVVQAVFQITGSY